MWARVLVGVLVGGYNGGRSRASMRKGKGEDGRGKGGGREGREREK